MRPSPDVVTEILQKTNLSKSCEKSIDHRRLSMNRLTNTVPFWHGCCRNKTQHTDFCFKCYLSSNFTAHYPNQQLYMTFFCITLFEKLFLLKYSYREGIYSKRNSFPEAIVKKVKKRAFLQRPERIRSILGRGKKSIQKCRNEPR